MEFWAAILLCWPLYINCFPFVLDDINQGTEQRSTNEKRFTLPTVPFGIALSKARTNCGPTPCGIFDASEQYVSTTGEHAWQAPTAKQVRGPCPGLNAAANHGYLDRSGFQTIQSTVTGLAAAFAMSADLSGFLAAYAILITGDPITLQWSIGGITNLLGKGNGLSFSHNAYEVTRADAWLNKGDAHSLVMSRFISAYNRLEPGKGATPGDKTQSGYTLDGFALNYWAKLNQSIAENPMFTAPFFAVAIASPIAYNFVINMMSNHSEENPNGWIGGEMLKSFFAVSGTEPKSFKWTRGHERIPENWYRRPSLVPYSVPSVIGDLAIQFLAYPDSLRIGCNVNGVNTYRGSNLSDITGGVLNHPSDLIEALTDGGLAAPTLQCFVAQLATQAVPESPLAPTLLNQLTSGALHGLTGNECPKLNLKKNYLANCPGMTYSPSGPDQPY